MFSCGSGRSERGYTFAYYTRTLIIIIVSDCWKSYHDLDKYGCSHQTVNHSKEFVNEDGYNTNKMEGHWRHMKASLPVFGTRKDNYSSYLAACEQRQRFIRDIRKWCKNSM